MKKPAAARALKRPAAAAGKKPAAKKQKKAAQEQAEPQQSQDVAPAAVAPLDSGMKGKAKNLAKARDSLQVLREAGLLEMDLLPRAAKANPAAFWASFARMSQGFRVEKLLQVSVALPGSCRCACVVCDLMCL